MCYADLYSNRFYHLSPWGTAEFWKDQENWPMAEVLSEKGMAKFGPSFQALVRTQREPSGLLPNNYPLDRNTNALI